MHCYTWGTSPSQAPELQWGWVQAIQISGDFEDDFLKVINVATQEIPEVFWGQCPQGNQ